MRVPFFKPLNGARAGFTIAGALIGLALVAGGLWSLSQLVQPSQASTTPQVTVPVRSIGVGSSADTRIVLVSGRDDHGLLEEPHIPLYQAPGSPLQVAQLHDGDFARVLEVRGNWSRIQTLALSPENGWIDEYYLRGKALRTEGGGQVEFAAARLVGDKVYVAVYPIGDGGAQITWLLPTELKEVGAV